MSELEVRTRQLTLVTIAGVGTQTDSRNE